jgi:nitrate reductase gamma subunit
LRLVPSSETFSDSFMKSLLLITTLLIIPGLFARAANAEQEKAFVAKYKTALEANDSATLQSVLYTTQSAGVLISLARREV